MTDADIQDCNLLIAFAYTKDWKYVLFSRERIFHLMFDTLEAK